MRLSDRYEHFKKMANEMFLGSQETQDYLMINRRRLCDLVKAGRLKPIKELKREFLFWQPDLEVLKKELLLDSRSNLYKNVNK